VRQRVLAYVTRERDGGKELLVFDHRDRPSAGTQVPAGRAEHGESLEDCLRRELREEAGLERFRVVREVPVLGNWVARSRYENHAFEISAEQQIADSFEHIVVGDGDDAGLVFLYRWVAIEPGLALWDGADSTYTQL